MANSQMVNSTRPFLCNFLGTVYKNSARETLMRILKKNRTGQRVHHYCLRESLLLLSCIRWLPQETAKSLRRYQTALAQKRAHPLPGGNLHGVLTHLRGLCLWFGARGGGHCDPRWVLCCTQLPTASPQSCRSPLHLSQGLEGAARLPGEGDEQGEED